MLRPACHLPIHDRGRCFRRRELSGDLLAAVIVTIMLVPQSLAYAMHVGLPPERGGAAGNGQRDAPAAAVSLDGGTATAHMGAMLEQDR